MFKSCSVEFAFATLLLSACNTVPPPAGSYQAYLDGIPVGRPQNCVDQAAVVAGKLQSAAGLRGVWWDCGHVAKKEELGRIARLVAGGAFGVSEFKLAKVAADYAARLPSDGLTDKDRADLTRLASLAGVLSEAPPMAHGPSMSFSGAKTVRLPATYDRAGLLRFPIQSNGQEIAAVLDTGAAISLMVESQAARLGLKVHSGSEVGSNTRTAVATNWALLPRMKVGEINFQNVLFLVVPDEAMGLPAGYTIDAIVGAPVLLQLQTVCVSEKTVTFAPASPDNRPEPQFVDVRFVENAPMLSIRVNDIPITAYLDSGANASKLSRRFANRYLGDLRSTSAKEKTIGGVGGTNKASLASLKDVRLGFATRTLSVEQFDVDLSPNDDDSEPFATIGQDVLRQSDGWKLDYPNARFEIGARCT